MTCVIVQQGKPEVIINTSRPTEVTIAVTKTDLTFTFDASCRTTTATPLPDFTFNTAGENITSYSVVYLGDDNNLYKFTAYMTDERALQVKGILVNIVDTGDRGQVQLSGELFKSDWNWTPELPVYVGYDGLLTQVIPTADIDLRVGTALTATTVFLDLEEPIVILP